MWERTFQTHRGREAARLLGCQESMGSEDQPLSSEHPPGEDRIWGGECSGQDRVPQSHTRPAQTPHGTSLDKGSLSTDFSKTRPDCSKVSRAGALVRKAGIGTVAGCQLSVSCLWMPATEGGDSWGGDAVSEVTMHRLVSPFVPKLPHMPSVAMASALYLRHGSSSEGFEETGGLHQLHANRPFHLGHGNLGVQVLGTSPPGILKDPHPLQQEASLAPAEAGGSE